MFLPGSIKIKIVENLVLGCSLVFKWNHTFYGQDYYFSLYLKNDNVLCQGKFSTFKTLRHRGTLRQRCLSQTEWAISPSLEIHCALLFSYNKTVMYRPVLGKVPDTFSRRTSRHVGRRFVWNRKKSDKTEKQNNQMKWANIHLNHLKLNILLRYYVFVF